MTHLLPGVAINGCRTFRCGFFSESSRLYTCAWAVSCGRVNVKGCAKVLSIEKMCLSLHPRLVKTNV